jgi:hypothetical protein
MLNSALVWYLAWGLIPAILSILLFKLTKSSATVSTQKPVEGEQKAEGGGSASNSILSRLVDHPLKHLAINITRAAALFFLLFTLMNPIKTGFYEKESNWRLKVDFKDGKGNPVPMSKFESVDPIPAVEHQFFDDKTLLVLLNDLREDNAKLRINYSLRIKFDGYETCTIPLTDSINNNMFCTKINDTKYIKMNSVFLNSRLPETIAATSQDTVVKVSEKSIN